MADDLKNFLEKVETKDLVEELFNRFDSAILVFRAKDTPDVPGGVQVAWVGDAVECAGLAGFGQTECYDDMRSATDAGDEAEGLEQE